MRLRDLHARLLRVEPSERLGHVGHVVETVAEANAIDFECPVGGGHGHHVRVYFKDRGVDPSLKPLPRWDVSGTNLDDVTISPSIHLNRDAPPPREGEPDVCRWHGHVRNGDAT